LTTGILAIEYYDLSKTDTDQGRGPGVSYENENSQQQNEKEQDERFPDEKQNRFGQENHRPQEAQGHVDLI
jgi:hypothetical protein